MSRSFFCCNLLIAFAETLAQSSFLHLNAGITIVNQLRQEALLSIIFCKDNIALSNLFFFYFWISEINSDRKICPQEDCPHPSKFSPELVLGFGLGLGLVVIFRETIFQETVSLVSK